MTTTPAPLLHADWPATPGVGAAISSRLGGVSRSMWASLNLGLAVGDETAAVEENRRRFAHAMGARPVWLRQVHGHAVLRLHHAEAVADLPPADAAWTTELGLACAVMVADCLPVLFATRDGRAVAAAHAGWRGLAGGVLEATVQALQEGAAADPAELIAWLGPCIGPRQFEVGEDVLRTFGNDPQDPDCRHFVSRPRPDGAPRWLANLPALAQARLQAAGLNQINVDGRCTVEDGSRFFSFRRDGVTGRLAAAVWRRR